MQTRNRGRPLKESMREHDASRTDATPEQVEATVETRSTLRPAKHDRSGSPPGDVSPSVGPKEAAKDEDRPRGSKRSRTTSVSHNAIGSDSTRPPLTSAGRARSEDWPDPLAADDPDIDTQSTVSDDPLSRTAAAPGYPPDAFQTEQWVDDTIKTRLLTFLGYANSVDNRYAVSKVPDEAAWGEGTSHEKSYRFAGEDVTIWLPGVVATKWFLDLKGEPPLRANIGVIPLRDMDKHAAVELLRHSNPPQDPKPGPIYAGKFMNQWVKGYEKPIIKPFLEIYDATSKFRQKKYMKALKQSDIGFGDIVLVECVLTRYKVGDNKTEPGWDEWKTGFELLSVSLLASAPDGTIIPSSKSVRDATEVSL